MLITPKAAAALDALIKLISDFQTELAPIDLACTNILDMLTLIQQGEIPDETIVSGLEAASATMARLPTAAKALQAVSPLADIVWAEIDKNN